MAVIFGLGTVTASYACSRDSETVAAVSAPAEDACGEHPMAVSCAQSCVAICHALTPPSPSVTRLALMPEARIGLEAGAMIGLASGPEPPPPRMT